MKLSKAFLALVLAFVPTLALAQGLPIRNDTPSNLRDLGSDLQVGRNFSVDQQGRILVGPSSPGTGAAIYAEDAAFPSGGNLSMMGGVNARSFATYNSTNGDATPISVGDRGVVTSMIMYDSSLAGGSSPVVPEDTALGNGQAAVAIGTQLQDPLTLDSASGDLGYNKADLLGRTIITYAPATERWSACSASNTGTSDTAIKALVASNRICVTSLSCFNTAAVASSFEIKSNATAIYAGGISNSTLAGVAYWEHSFPTPICTAVGEALNFDMATNATATTCCGAGFITVN